MPSPVSIGTIGCGAIGEEHAKCLIALTETSLRAVNVLTIHRPWTVRL